MTVEIYNKLLNPSYEVSRYDFNILFTQGIKKDGYLIIRPGVIKTAEILESGKNDQKGNCQVFDQFLKEYPDFKNKSNPFKNVFINIDFNSFVKTGGNVEKALNQIKNGIQFIIKDKKFTFIDFLKSNSMSKNARLFYINKDYKDFADKRITFSFINEERNVCVPKFYAYSGLSLSDTTILPNIHFEEGEIVVIPDLESKTGPKAFITAISVKYLIDRISKLNSLIVDDQSCQEEEPFLKLCRINPQVNEIKEEFEAYLNSKEFFKFVLKDQDKDDNVKLFKRFNQYEMTYLINNLCQCFDKTIQDTLAYTNSISEEEYDNFNEKLKENELYNDEIYWQKISVTLPVKVNHFDGEGLIDKNFVENDIYDEINRLQGTSNEKYKFGNSFQIRLPFIKGVVHSCDFKTFFREKGVSKIVGLTYNEKNPVKEYDISNVKIILTESQFKASKLFKTSDIYDEEESKVDAFIKVLRSFDYSLGISFELGLTSYIDHVNLNYQFLSTLPFSEKEINNLLNDNIASYKKDIENSKILSIIKEDTTSYYEQDLKLLEAGFEDFYVGTDRFKAIKKKTMNSLKNDLYQMKLNYPGFRKYNSGDLLELLYYSCFHSNMNEFKRKFKDQRLDENEFYAPNTNLKNKTKPFVLLRNPHYSKLEIGILYAYKDGGKNNPTERRRYFGHLTGTLMVNSASCIPERLGGSDMDGDQIVILNHTNCDDYLERTMVNSGNDRPFIKIPSSLSERKPFSYENRAKCLANTFSSRVGLISNNALRKVFELDKNKDYFDRDDEVALYTILCGLEIDSVKNGLKPYLITNEYSEEANFFIRFKGKLSGLLTPKKNDKETFLNNASLNNIFLIGSKLKELDNIRCTSKKNSYECFEGNTNTKDIGKIIIAHLIYSKLNYNIEDDTTLTDIYNNIVKICVDIDDVDDLIQSFRTGNEKELLEIYMNGKKFHYLQDDQFKRDVLALQFKFDLNHIDKRYVDRVCDFSNNGVYLLYYILMYNYYFSRESNLVEDDFIKLDKNGIVDYYLRNEFEYLTDLARFTEPEKDELYQDFVYEVERVNKINKEYELNKESINKIKEELRYYVEGVDINNYLFFKNKTINNESSRRNTLKGNIGNSFSIDILLDNLIEYLSKEGE